MQHKTVLWAATGVFALALLLNGCQNPTPPVRGEGGPNPAQNANAIVQSASQSTKSAGAQAASSGSGATQSKFGSPILPVKPVDSGGGVDKTGGGTGPSIGPGELGPPVIPH